MIRVKHKATGQVFYEFPFYRDYNPYSIYVLTYDKKVLRFYSHPDHDFTYKDVTEYYDVEEAESFSEPEFFDLSRWKLVPINGKLQLVKK